MLQLLLNLLLASHAAGTSSGADGACFDAINLCNLPCPDNSPRAWAAPNVDGVLYPCCPPGMDMVSPPVRSTNYSITSSSQTFCAGEWISIAVDVLAKGAKYIGFMLYAVEDDALETKVGEWALRPGSSPEFWTPPECSGKVVMHANAGMKHYHHEFQFRIPGASTGNIRFRVLLKHGETNGGAFFWPAKDLVIPNSCAASSDPFWIESDAGASCTSACNAVESNCDAASLMSAYKQDRDNQFPQGSGRFFTCHHPVFSNNGELCHKTALSSDESGHCFYRDDGLCSTHAENVCDEVSSADHGRFCACVASTAAISTSGASSTTISWTSTSTSATDYLEPDFAVPSDLLELSAGTNLQLEYFTMAFVVASFGIRNPLISLLPLAILPFISEVQAHNWKNNPPSRIFGLTKETPCPSRPGNSINFAVAGGERFGLEWTTGHAGRSSINYIAIVRREDEDKLRLHDDALFEDYLARAPNGARSTDAGGFLSEKVFDKTHIRVTGRQPFGSPPILGSGDGSMYTKELTRDDAAFFERPRDWRCSRTRRCRGDEEFHQYEYIADGLKNDVRAAYFSDIYPWLLAVAKYTIVYHRPQDYDLVQLKFPESAVPGGYIIQYNWRGYRDCWDVLLSAPNTVPPQLIVQDVWVKHDHCQFENVNTEFGCSVLEATADVTQCQRRCDEQPGCAGINVVPYNSNNFNRFGNQVNIPFSQKCRRRDVAAVASQDALVCYGFVPPAEPEVGTAFTTSDDPRDPIFYSTCFQKQRLTRIEGQDIERSPGSSQERQHLLVDGCSSQGRRHESRFAADDSPVGFVTCCSMNGSFSARRIDGQCLGGNAGQNGERSTYAEATAICRRHQMRLCSTSDEVDMSCGTGCSYNNVLVWTSDAREPDPERFIFGDQCISCEDAQAIANLPETVVPRWKLAEECKLCR